MGCASSQPATQKSNDYPKQKETKQQPAPQQQKPVGQVQPQQQQKQQPAVNQQPIKPVVQQNRPPSAPVQQKPPPEQQKPQQQTKAPSPEPQPPKQEPPKQNPTVTVEPEKDEKTEIEIKQMDITKDLLQKYIDLEKQSRVYEQKNILKKAENIKRDLMDITVTYDKMSADYKKLEENTAREKADVDNLKKTSVVSYFKENNIAGYDAKLSKEEEEYIDALNKQEVLGKELKIVATQKEKLEDDLSKLEDEGMKLSSIYKEQDEMLAAIFDGKYGSEKENELEMELDSALDRKQRIKVAMYKWTNARVLLQHACNQLAFATRRWQDLSRCGPGNVAGRYTVATETRNNLIASSQNISSAQRYLTGITFPYCKPEEVETLNKAVNNIYNDMQSADRQAHALSCYSTTHKRAAALVQWFESVINGTIKRDQDKATKGVAEKDQALRNERLSLIKQKIKEVLGEDVDIDIQEGYDGDAEDFEEELAKLVEPDTVSINSLDKEGDEAAAAGVVIPAGQDALSAPESQNAEAPTPMPLSELAPPPDNDDLFGNIDELKKQHEKEMEEFQKAQAVNKARMDQGLQEKLAARRSRRQRQSAQETQAEKSG